MDVTRTGRLARHLRVRARLTQRQLATRAGVSERAVYLLETGRGRSLRLRAIESIVGSLSARIDWLVRVEVSYAHFGERGRVDLLAFHPPTGVLLVIEVKTLLVDVQELLGSLDAKTRLARTIAAPLGWHPKVVVPAIVFAERPATRAQVAQLDTLFDRFTVRGRRALTWMRNPGEPPTGLLWFRQLPPAARRDSGGQRVYARSSAA